MFYHIHKHNDLKHTRQLVRKHCSRCPSWESVSQGDIRVVWRLFRLPDDLLRPP